ncbi:response regulator transcription factor [Neptunitalea lumnitzerae]|uniref:response regulator transcription factor n=1 Tax=Neptunitalea lumnitzerae TaxID=2965509 RepID=UPI002493CF00|nr:response regulator transcription factor [Neptunitalea sp. Y10]
MKYRSFFKKYKTTILYGVSLALLLFLLRWLELRFVVFEHYFEIYIGFIALIFTALGIWLAAKLTKPKVETRIIEKEIYITPKATFTINTQQLEMLEITKRELEILQLIALGHTNQEIASELSVSVSTVKSHNQNLFSKLQVQRRTQAVEKAKRLGLIP